MDDFLETVVQKCMQDDGGSELILSAENMTHIQFKLPIEIYLRHGDTIVFKNISKKLENPRITHSDYATAEIYHAINTWRTKKELIIILDSADMRLLEMVKKDYRPNTYSED